MRKRRQRSTWFPVLGTENGGENPLSSVYTNFVPVRADYSTSFEITPLIPDYSEDPSIATSSDNTLRDFVEGQTCIIDRIVGKICVFFDQQKGSDSINRQPRIATFAAGIAVLPCDDAGTPLTTGSGPELDPLAAENLDKPWLWRRTWTLCNLAETDSAFQYSGPRSNTECGSVADGPHIDTKGTKRAIQRNQRIFLIYGAQNETPGDESVEDGSSFWTVDLRVLGRMRRARNRSIFT